MDALSENQVVHLYFGDNSRCVRLLGDQGPAVVSISDTRYSRIVKKASNTRKEINVKLITQKMRYP